MANSKGLSCKVDSAKSLRYNKEVSKLRYPNV